MANERPEKLRPYFFMGVNLEWKDGDKDAYGDCLFCGREKKFSVKIETGQFRCVVCEEGNESGGGNVYTFLRQLWEGSDNQFDSHPFVALQEDRRLLYSETLAKWGIRKSLTNDDWIAPGYNADGKLMNLYRYVDDGKRMAWFPAPTLKHQLFGVQLFDSKKPTVYLTEGIWDAMALWETMSRSKQTESGDLVQTGNPDACLLAKANVIAIAASHTFTEEMLPLFAGKNVILMGQNDHPKDNQGKVVAPASYNGVHRIVRMFHASDCPPSSIQMLNYGEGGYDPKLPSGFDIRDALTT